MKEAMWIRTTEAEISRDEGNYFHTSMMTSPHQDVVVVSADETMLRTWRSLY